MAFGRATWVRSHIRRPGIVLHHGYTVQLPRKEALSPSRHTVPTRPTGGHRSSLGLPALPRALLTAFGNCRRRVGCNRIGLGIGLRDSPNLRAGCTHAVSNDQNRVLELRRAVWAKLLDRTDGAFIHSVTEAIIRILSRRILPSARAQ